MMVTMTMNNGIDHHRSYTSNSCCYIKSIKMLRLIICCFTILGRLDFVYAWGKEGHEMVADIAYQRLSKDTQEIVSNILFPMPDNDNNDNNDDDNSNRKQDGYDKSKYASPMSAVATWADRMRYTKEFAWTEPLHFVDIRDDLIPGGCPSHSNSTVIESMNDEVDNHECSFSYTRDCNNERCAVYAIQQFSSQLYPSHFTLMDSRSHHSNRLRGTTTIGKQMSMSTWPMTNFTTRQSLMFLIHIVGDIHQPMHVSRKSDIGGNTIHVQFPKAWQFHYLDHSRRLDYKEDETMFIKYPPVHIIHHNGWNLHSVWDSGMIEYVMEEKFNNSQSEYLSYIENTYIQDNERNVDLWNKCIDTRREKCVEIWAEESWEDAIHFAYGDEKGNEIKNGDSLTRAYIATRLPVVERRIAAAGVRLASVLELIYSSREDKNDDESIYITSE